MSWKPPEPHKGGAPAPERSTRPFPPAATSRVTASGQSGSTRPGPSRPQPARFAIPRSQLWLFWGMLLLVLAMAIYLIRLRERTRDHFAAASQPLTLTSAEAHQEPLRLYLASDADGSLAEKPILFPLPSDPNTRARVVLEKLLQEYAAPGSSHPLNTGTGVEDVYLLPVPGFARGHGELAVVNLTTAFVHNHPSGIEPETLTLLSMIATLRANLPAVTQVRFLVDGQEQPTLAGHADLTHAYLAAASQMAPEAGSSAKNGAAGGTTQP